MRNVSAGFITARERRKMSLLRYFIVGAVLSAVASPTSETHQKECRALRGSMCADHFGTETWYGLFPNDQGLDKDDSIAEFFHFFALLHQDNYCSHLIHNLLCYLYFPPCSPQCPGRGVTPSRQLCEEAVEACLPYAQVLYGSTFQKTFPKFINCSSFAQESSSVGTCPTSRGNTTTAIESCCSTDTLHSPNATIHIDFNPPIGSRVYQAVENESSVEICVVLANTGSYDPMSTLGQSITLKLLPQDTKTSFLPSADLGSDYSFPATLLTFPAGSITGQKLCVDVLIFNDYLKEGRETFSVEVISLSPLLVTFGSGGAAQSSSGSVEIIIVDDDEPFIPEDECRGKCSIRNRANPNTFTQNSYTYAVHVEAIGRRDSNHSSLLDIIILECWELEAAGSVCPGGNHTHCSIPVCPDCTLEFRGGEEYLIAGRHIHGNGLYLPNYRKGGLLAMWRRSYSSVGQWVGAATNNTTH